jgi:predicted phosphoribosyltransferase
MFRDRADAARRLAARLTRYRDRNPLILAIPRGAVPMGRILADELGGELDVVLTHKLGAPHQPELAIGSVSEEGALYLNRPLIASLGVSEGYIEAEKGRQLAVLRERRRALGREPADPAARVVIVVDDGIATGATMRLALEGVGDRGPERLVAAVPVGPPDAVAELAELADEVVCLATPEYFVAIGQFYDVFDQVSDEEVAAILRGQGPPRPEVGW